MDSERATGEVMDALEEFSRQVRCFCRKSVVVSRMDSAWDEFVVCCRGCFELMVQAKPEYWEVVGGRRKDT